MLDSAFRFLEYCFYKNNYKIKWKPYSDCFDTDRYTDG